MEGVHKAQSRIGLEERFRMSLHPLHLWTRKAGRWARIDPARRLIIPSRAVVAEQSHLTAHWRNGSALVQQAEVDMSIVVRMKVILSPPGLILKERPRTEVGFKPTQASAK